MFPRSVPYERSPPERTNIVTVGMPGVTSTRSQMSRYTGGDPVTVLCNWADDPNGPLHAVDKSGNRFAHMPIGQRLKRAARLWNYCVFGCEGNKEKCDEDVVPTDGVSRVPVSHARVAARSSRQDEPTKTVAAEPSPDDNFSPASLLSSTTTTTMASTTKITDAPLHAADIGLVDPPVLYRATCRIAPRLIHGVLPSPEVTEMRHRHWCCTVNPLHWMLTVKELLTGWWFCVRPFQFCYSEAGRSNMGGLRDQATYRREVRRAIHKIDTEAAALEQQHQQEQNGDAETVAAPSASSVPKKHLVLFGVSRGAATCFYTAMKLGPEEAKRVSLVLVEAPFDTLEHVINASSRIPCLVRWFFRACCDWRGSKDEQAAYDFDPREVHLRCPIAFVMSVKDRRVPNECTQALIDRVRRELVPHVIPAVEVLVLQHSRHPCMAVGHKDDQDAYVNFVEGLYNKYCPAS